MDEPLGGLLPVAAPRLAARAGDAAPGALPVGARLSVRIEVEGSRATVDVDGRRHVDVDQLGARPPHSGARVVCSDRHYEAADACVRKLRLGAAAPAPATPATSEDEKKQYEKLKKKYAGDDADVAAINSIATKFDVEFGKEWLDWGSATGDIDLRNVDAGTDLAVDSGGSITQQAATTLTAASVDCNPAAPTIAAITISTC